MVHLALGAEHLCLPSSLADGADEIAAGVSSFGDLRINGGRLPQATGRECWPREAAPLRKRARQAR